MMTMMMMVHVNYILNSSPIIQTAGRPLYIQGKVHGSIGSFNLYYTK